MSAHSGMEGNERVDELATRFRKWRWRILSQEAPLCVLDNVVVTGNSLEALRQALVGETVQNRHGEEDNSNKNDVETCIELENLTSQELPPPCISPATPVPCRNAGGP